MFYTKIDLRKNKEIFDYIKGHFQYDGTIANNVKMYNLELSGSYEKAYDELLKDEYNKVNTMLANWEADNDGYMVWFEGRNGGYLCLYKTPGQNIIEKISPFYLTDIYEELKDDNMYYEDLVYELHSYGKIILSFDKLCDKIRDFVNTLSY